MNTRSVNAAAGVIARAMEAGYVTPAGWASALESAQLLQSPERAAEFERLRAERDEFCDRVDTLTAVAKGNKRHVAALFAELQKAQRERDEALARIAELELERHSTNEALSEAAEALRDQRDRIADLEAVTPAPIQTCRKCGAGYDYGRPCSTCEFRARMAAELEARSEGEHYAAVHHDYRVSHDLPPLGGAE